MPIPKPRTGEPRNAFVSRCMGDDKMNSEYSDPKQRAAVCHTSWREARMAADDKTFELDAEILAEGKWNNIDITRSVMDQMVANFRTFKDILDVPLKFGHNDKQQMTDGLPALGWIKDVWISDAGKMMARLSDMPKIVYEAIKAKRYKNVSIEASLEVTHKGKEYGAVLTGLALLGADIPAVNTLNDLQTYMTAQNDLEFHQCASFSAIGGNLSKPKGGSAMTPEEEVAKLKAELALKQAEEVKFKAEQEAKLAAAEAKLEALEHAQNEAKFAADKKTVEDDMETLVKAGQLTPGMRDKFAAQIKDADTLAFVSMSIGILKEGAKDKGLDTGDKGLDDKGEKEFDGMTPAEILHAKAVQYSAEKDVPYNNAVEIIMLKEPSLAREYTDQFDKEAS